ncbi:MAG: family 3 adenylate cyclase [Phycisphaerae bacterium]|nr:family 3 adenylate cyclase [Saprospiraceae bacterium]
MAKLSADLYSPGLFDIKQDIIGSLPLALVKDWLETGQSKSDAVALLSNYKVKGFSVSSDAAGLSKLSKTKPLLEVLAMLNRPKEIVYTMGKQIGGKSIGIWAADNTQMFYPAEVQASHLLSALLTAQAEINKTCQVKIGLGAHFGEYYHINGGLYGEEADAIEEFAENETEGGEVLISQSIYQMLPSNHGFEIVKTGEATSTLGQLYSVISGPLLSEIPELDKHYPIPYSQDFYEDLIQYEDNLSDTALAGSLEEKYLNHRVVVLIERESQESAEHMVNMFTDMSFSALMKDAGIQLLTKHNGHEIKVVGNLGIYVFDSPHVAFSFSKEFQDVLNRQNVETRIGIDRGPVLVFDLPAGGKDIAGMPVNIASKMAQDKGRFGYVYLNGHLSESMDVSALTQISYTVSDVEMTIYEG